MAGEAKYLRVNVYRVSGGWSTTVQLMEAGKPYPRLDRTLWTWELMGDSHSLETALLAAADRLQHEARHSQVH